MSHKVLLVKQAITVAIGIKEEATTGLSDRSSSGAVVVKRLRIFNIPHCQLLIESTTRNEFTVETMNK